MLTIEGIAVKFDYKWYLDKDYSNTLEIKTSLPRKSTFRTIFTQENKTIAIYNFPQFLNSIGYAEIM